MTLSRRGPTWWGKGAVRFTSPHPISKVPKGGQILDVISRATYLSIIQVQYALCAVSESGELMAPYCIQESEMACDGPGRWSNRFPVEFAYPIKDIHRPAVAIYIAGYLCFWQHALTSWVPSEFVLKINEGELIVDVGR